MMNFRTQDEISLLIFYNLIKLIAPIALSSFLYILKNNLRRSFAGNQLEIYIYLLCKPIYKTLLCFMFFKKKPQYLKTVDHFFCVFAHSTREIKKEKL